MALATNTLEGRAEPYVNRIETLHADLKSLRGKYMADCKVVREDIKEIYTEVKSAGLPVKAIKGVVKYRELERKQDEIASGLDMAEQADYGTLIETLGDLGRAAADRAGHQNDEERDLRPTSLKRTEAELAADRAAASRKDGDINTVGRGPIKDGSAAVDSITKPSH
jgi:uncharacterized protein (UPF0335 family)